MTIASFIAFALTDMVCGTLRTMSRASKDAQAYELVDELTEQTRAYGFEHLSQFKGQPYTLTVNNEVASTYENAALQNRALLLDLVRRSWNSKSISGKFNGTVTYYVFDGPEPDTLNVAIDLNWQDSSTGAERSLGRVIVVINS